VTDLIELGQRLWPHTPQSVRPPPSPGHVLQAFEGLLDLANSLGTLGHTLHSIEGRAVILVLDELNDTIQGQGAALPRVLNAVYSLGVPVRASNHLFRVKVPHDPANGADAWDKDNISLCHDNRFSRQGEFPAVKVSGGWGLGYPIK